MNTIRSLDQFKTIRIEDNLVVNYILIYKKQYSTLPPITPWKSRACNLIIKLKPVVTLSDVIIGVLIHHSFYYLTRLCNPWNIIALVIKIKQVMLENIGSGTEIHQIQSIEPRANALLSHRNLKKQHFGKFYIWHWEIQKKKHALKNKSCIMHVTGHATKGLLLIVLR